MSYILDALRKSESERRQGRVPDLGVSVQMVHKPNRRRIHWSVWLTVALLANAAVFGAFYWQNRNHAGTTPVVSAAAPSKGQGIGQNSGTGHKVASPDDRVERPAGAPPATSVPLMTEVPASTGKPSSAPLSRAKNAGDRGQDTAPQVAAGEMLIRPHRSPTRVSAAAAESSSGPAASGSTVPELAEMPLSFQRQVPDLHFNGHIYASNPQARRVMIDNVYLAQGDRFKGLRIVEITPDGVIMSLDGNLFRVGVVQDWIRPN